MTDPTFQVAIPNGFAQRYANILQTMVLVVAVVGALWAAVINPLQHQLEQMNTGVEEKLEKLRDDNSKAYATVLTIREHEEYAKSQTQLSMDVRAALAYLRDTQITRAEYAAYGEQTKATISGNRAEIDRLGRDFGSQYPIADKIKDLQNQISALQAALQSLSNGKGGNGTH